MVAAPMGIELKSLTRRLGHYEPLKHAPYKARESVLSGRKIITVCTGINRLQIQQNLTLALDDFSPSRVLFIGIAGALRPEFRVGDPFMVSAASQWIGDSETLSLDQALTLKNVYHSLEEPRISIIKGGRRVRRARLLSVDNFVGTTQEKRRLGAAGFDLVDLEFAAVAIILSERGLPLSGLKVVSDSLPQNFPSFHYSLEAGRKGVPPARLMANTFRACRLLGRFTHAWLQTLII